MFAVVVVFDISPGRMPAFLPLVCGNAQISLRDEPGCHQFDVATDPARPDEVLLYELYSDAEAFAAHLDSPHFAEFAAGSDSMIAHKTVRTYGSVRQ